MKTFSTLALASAVGLGVVGCANPVADAVADAAVCVESARILTGMNDVLDLAGANPLALATYVERIGELNDEFAALEPRGEELISAHQALTEQIDSVITAASQPNLDSLVGLPDAIAQIELAAMDYLAACTP